MVRFRFLALVAVVLALIVPRMTVGQPVLTGSVVGHGGMPCSDATHMIVATVGQSVIGHCNCPSHTGDFGFWYAKAGLVTALSPGQIAVLPTAFRLEQNYPNPFNPSTTIQYTVAGARGRGLGSSEVRIVIYDVLGREVATLVDTPQAPGNYEVRFDGSRLASGVYYYRLTAGQATATRAMVLAK